MNYLMQIHIKQWSTTGVDFRERRCYPILEVTIGANSSIKVDKFIFFFFDNYLLLPLYLFYFFPLLLYWHLYRSLEPEKHLQTHLEPNLECQILEIVFMDQVWKNHYQIILIIIIEYFWGIFYSYFIHTLFFFVQIYRLTNVSYKRN